MPVRTNRTAAPAEEADAPPPGDRAGPPQESNDEGGDDE